MHNWSTTCIIASALLLSAVGVAMWKRKKRSYVCVGKISRLFYYPVKSMKGIEIKEGLCTSLGFVVDGFLDRTFMVVDGKGKLVSQRDAPTLVLLTPAINDKTLLIKTPSGKELRVEIKESINPGDKIVQCVVHSDSIDALDCGDLAAEFLQSYLNLPDVRLVQYFPSLRGRKYLQKNPFMSTIKKKHAIGFQDLAAFHLVSKTSIDDLNSRLEEVQVSELNFRPNILVEGSKAFEEDSWKHLSFRSGAELSQLIPTTRCILTTNDPSTGIITKKEPLVTMRKYRIPKDPDLLKKIGSLPCMGISLATIQNGLISVGDDIYADIGEIPEMLQK